MEHLTHQHDYEHVATAALMCALGSSVTMRLLMRTLLEERGARWPWGALTAAIGGSTVWTTHFVAMLGWRPGVPVAIDTELTVLSALIAVLGCGVAVATVCMARRSVAIVGGGATLGFAIGAMHYLGMAGYGLAARIVWNPSIVAASLLLGAVFGGFAIAAMRRDGARCRVGWATAFMTAAVVSLHFTGMAAMTVVPTRAL